ncbi:MAG: efflux RND transporter permease subunit [Gemmataceae bacterium]|jgi:multidrug efflux pump subunit AcrB|nr:efflux RND transporter permease subunit [Gemmataceae bacterium]
MNLVRLAVGNIYGVIVFAIAIGVLGGLALVSIPVDILPSFKVPAVQVLTYFNGMPADSVEKTITNRVERWVNQAPGVRQVESRSVPGVSVVRVLFREDIDPNAALTMSNSLALGTLPTLPPNTLPPVVLPFDPTGTLPLGILTVSNPSLSEAGVKDLARINVRNQLGGISGVVAPVVVGGQDRTILVYLDPKKLQSRNLSMTDVVKALQDGNLMVTPGTAYFGDNQVLLDTNAMVPNVEELNQIPIRTPGGGLVTLGDLGFAQDSASIQTSRVRINGKEQVFVPIYRQGGSSSLRVADGVREAIPDIEAQLPEGTKLEFVIDQSDYVRKSIESLIHEGIVGAILVSIMILIFLGNWRMTIIATLALPLSILGAIIGLKTTGNTINVMTLGGLFLAIGPLVDNAIVVLENIHRHMGMGKSALQAAIDATSELTLPVIVATLSLIIVLCPVALTPGVGGFLFQPLTIAVGFAMIFSFILSWTFVPAMCSQLLRGHSHPQHQGQRHEDQHPNGQQREVQNHQGQNHAGQHQQDQHGETTEPASFFAKLYQRIDGVIQYAGKVYEALLFKLLKKRLLVMSIIFSLLLGSLALVPFIGQEFFPAVDAGQITILVRAPSNNRLSSTTRQIARLEEFIQKQIPEEERNMIVSEIGLNPDWSAAYTQNSGQMDAVIRLQLTPERKKSAQEYAIVLRKAIAAEPEFSDLQVAFDTGGMVTAALNFGASSPIDVEISGGTPEAGMELAAKVRDQIRTIPGAADVRVKQRLDAPYLILEVNRMKAAEVGLTTRDVMLQVVAAMNSSASINRNFWIDSRSGNQYFVAVQYAEDADRELDDLKRISATGTSSGRNVSLASLVEMRPSTAAVEIDHNSLRRTVNILINTEGRDIGSVASDIQKKIKQIEVPKGMRITLKGEYARMKESFQSLGVGLALAAVLVYLLMVPLMRSFVMPLIIMATIPLGLIGVLVMLWSTGTSLNVQSEMGVIFLVGIVVSQGVLLMDFANQLRKQGKPVFEAITQAAVIRFRPIMMTFLATFLDLLPMAIGLGRGSEALTPLARAVVGGLITATLLTLIVVPILYTLLIHDRVPTNDPQPESHPVTQAD